MAQEFWIDSSRVGLFPCAKIQPKTSMSRAAPGRVTVASETPHLPLIKPLQGFTNQVKPNSDGPAPFFYGAIYLSHHKAA